MKKKIILLLTLILCVGCTRIDNIEDYSIIIDKIINNNYNNQNTTSLGYTYYLPLGVSKVYDKDYNQKLKTEDTFMYLYVDAVSYYYQNNLNLEKKNKIDNYYYKEIDKDGKKGYVVITKEDNDNVYFIKVVYNYAKIESYVPKTKIENTLANSMIILKSINYNDNLIKKILEEEHGLGVDKEYKIDKPTNATSKFSEYLSEYVEEKENTIPDLPEY